MNRGHEFGMKGHGWKPTSSYPKHSQTTYSFILEQELCQDVEHFSPISLILMVFFKIFLGVYKDKFRPREPLHENIFWMSKIDRHFDLIISILCTSSLLKGLLYRRSHLYSKTHNTNHVVFIWSFHRNNEYEILVILTWLNQNGAVALVCRIPNIDVSPQIIFFQKMLLRYSDKKSFHIVLHLNKSQFYGLDDI